MKSLLLSLTLLFSSHFAIAQTQDIYPFQNQQKQQMFNQLLLNLRCLVCQNQNLADSNAGLAKDLKKQVYDMVQQGDSEQKIIEYLTARYGDFVLFKPAVKANTYFLWFAPLLFLLVGVGVMARNIRRKRVSD